MAVGSQTVRVRFDGTTTGLSRASREAHSAVGGVGSAVRGLAGAAAAAAALAATAAVGLAALTVKVANMAANLELQGNKAKAVFKDQLPAVQNWAQANAKSMGLTSREATGLAANFADLLVPMGFTAKQASEMSRKVIGLSGALAEWSGGTRTSAEVSEILSSAMLGERDALKGLGIAISEEDVKARLAAKGQDKLTGARLEQAQAIATMELIFEKSADAQSAFAAGGDSLARKIGGWKAAFGDWRDDMVVKLTPAIKEGAAALQAWVADPTVQAWFRDLGNTLKDIAEKAFPVIRTAWMDLVSAFSENKEQIKAVVEIIGVALIGSVIATIAVMAALVRAIGLIVNAVSWFVRTFLDAFSNIISAAAVAFGWVPGIGGKLQEAAIQFNIFRDRVNSSLDNLRDHTINITAVTHETTVGGGGGGRLARQHGGPVMAGRSYLVGEEGPELVTPMRSGFVHSAAETAAGTGASIGDIVVENHIEIGGEVVRVVRSVISERDRGLKRRVLAGAR